MLWSSHAAVCMAVRAVMGLQAASSRGIGKLQRCQPQSRPSWHVVRTRLSTSCATVPGGHCPTLLRGCSAPLCAVQWPSPLPPAPFVCRHFSRRTQWGFGGVCADFAAALLGSCGGGSHRPQQGFWPNGGLPFSDCMTPHQPSFHMHHNGRGTPPAAALEECLPQARAQRAC